MSTGIESPFAVKSDLPAAPAQPQAPHDVPRKAPGAALGTFRFSMMLSLVKGSLNKVGSVIDEGIEDEDLSVNEDGTYDDEFDQATHDALVEAEAETQRLLASIGRFKGLVEARLGQMA